jgi:NAD dependent epimerase/dehydratase
MPTGRLALVTGAGGFIGSHLVEGLLQAGYHVRALVRYTSHGGAGWLEQLPGQERRLEVVHGDVTDPRLVRDAVRGCTHIFHLAALIGIPYSYVAPASYVDVNIGGTLNVLEAARAESVQRVVVTSTSEVYGTALYTPIDEQHPLQAQSPYAATKVGADHLALSYHRAFGLPVTVVRPFNTYGPRQSLRAVIPTIISQALHGDTVAIGSRSPVRDMVFVNDTVAGFLAVAESSKCLGSVTNLATGVGVSVGDLIGLIMDVVGRRLTVVETEERKRPEASEVFRLLGSAKRAHDEAGWTARVSLAQGLARTVDWFRKHADTTRSGEYRL